MTGDSPARPGVSVHRLPDGLWSVYCRQCEGIVTDHPTWRLAMWSANRHVRYHQFFTRPR